jgi:hypothetical protein
MPVTGCSALVLHDVELLPRKVRSILSVSPADQAPSLLGEPLTMRLTNRRWWRLWTFRARDGRAGAIDRKILRLRRGEHRAELQFESEWDVLVERSSRWISTPNRNSTRELMGRAFERADRRW